MTVYLINILCYDLHTMFIVDLEILGYALLCFFPFLFCSVYSTCTLWVIFFIIINIFVFIYNLSVLLVIFILSSVLQCKLFSYSNIIKFHEMIRCHVHPFHADFRNNFVYSYIVNLTNFHRIKLPQFTFIH